MIYLSKSIIMHRVNYVSLGNFDWQTSFMNILGKKLRHIAVHQEDFLWFDPDLQTLIQNISSVSRISSKELALLYIRDQDT